MPLLPCPLCTRDDFKSAGGLKRHILAKHPTETNNDPDPDEPDQIIPDDPDNSNRPHQPTMPPLHGASPRNMTDAASSNTTTGNPSVCGTCGMVFANLRGLQSHRPSHPMVANLDRLKPRQKRPNINKPGLSPEENCSNLITECDRWFCRFEAIYNDLANFDPTNFDTTFKAYAKFLYTANERLPAAPVNPKSKYYRLRKEGKLKKKKARQSKSSNPSRTDKRRRKHNQEDFEYETIQHDFFFCRKKAVRKVLTSPNDTYIPCPIPMEAIEEHFKVTLSEPNHQTIHEYRTRSQQENISVTIPDVNKAIKSINLDTSPGYDGVMIRTVRDLGAGNSMKVVTDIMLATGHVPQSLTDGKTILIYKKGDPNDISNWRPITIHSILRRVVEKTLVRALRSQLDLNSNQKGFVAGMPGCQVNSSLLNGCLRQAKKKNTDCYAVMLDVSKAFDNVGHCHIDNCMAGQGVSRNLRQLVSSLLRSNSIRIDIGGRRSNSIQVKRSVPQGSPLSPLLFNLSINHIYEELCDQQFASHHGLKPFEDLEALSLLGFADDQLIISRTIEGASRLIELTEEKFLDIGLKVNPAKSIGIAVKGGKLTPGDLQLSNGTTIHCIDRNEPIKYLGTTFTDEIVFDSGIVHDITLRINSLIATPLLKKEQKMIVLNQYILPSLTFPLQSAPRRKIPKEDMRTLDLIIRNSIKAILGLPTSTSTEFIYAPKSKRGLGAIRCEWEIFIQHYNIAKRLLEIPDNLLHRFDDWKEEMQICRDELDVVVRHETPTARQLRDALRERACDAWNALDYQGEGAVHFSIYPKANPLTNSETTLTSTELTDAHKLSINYAPLAGVKGATRTHGSNRCRRCRREIETIRHVSGACDFGLNRRIERHHKVKHRLRTLLEEKGFICYDEAECKDGDGTPRRIDILAYDPRSNKAYLIDPTVRYPRNEDIDTMVQQEKRQTYESCYEDIAKRYPQHGRREFEVIGLWMGARGEIGYSMLNFFERFGLSKRELRPIAEMVLISTIKIIKHHVYSSS